MIVNCSLELPVLWKQQFSHSSIKLHDFPLQLFSSTLFPCASVNIIAEGSHRKPNVIVYFDPVHCFQFWQICNSGIQKILRTGSLSPPSSPFHVCVRMYVYMYTHTYLYIYIYKKGVFTPWRATARADNSDLHTSGTNALIAGSEESYKEGWKGTEKKLVRGGVCPAEA